MKTTISVISRIKINEKQQIALTKLKSLLKSNFRFRFRKHALTICLLFIFVNSIHHTLETVVFNLITTSNYVIFFFFSHFRYLARLFLSFVFGFISQLLVYKWFFFFSRKEKVDFPHHQSHPLTKYIRCCPFFFFQFRKFPIVSSANTKKKCIWD